ncbi:MAG: hypothetical protein KDK66_01405 [Deltaproteobacteria bacterium]|nr:hypothetical protein [Deltaproteobacteria bacterium]
MAGIGIIVNPKGRHYKQDPGRIQRLSFIVGDKGSYSPTEDLHDLRRVLEEFKTRDIDILGIGGGDGTNHVVLTHLIDIYGEKELPQLAFLRGGTMNTLANSVGIKGAPEKILSRLIYKYHEGKSFKTDELDIMKINDEYGFIFGCGGIYNFMQAYYAGSWTASPPKAVYTLGRSVASAMVNGAFARQLFERIDGEITVDGETWPYKNYSAIVSSSIPVLGLHFRVFHYSDRPGCFHAMALSMPPRNVLPAGPSLFLGREHKKDGILEKPAKEMRVSMEKPMGFTIDGDMLKPQKDFVIKNGPRLKILVR